MLQTENVVCDRSKLAKVQSSDIQRANVQKANGANLSIATVNFKVSSDWAECHNRAVRGVRNLRSAQSEVLMALIEVEERKVYHQFEVTSLYSYCVDILGLPAHTSYDFIDVVRTSKTIPNLAKAVIEGRTTITKARRICSVLTVENQKQWIELACECSQKIVQKAAAMANPRAAAPESLKYISGELLELTVAVSEEWSELLTDVKDLMSQKEQRAVSTEEALFNLMADYQKRNDPVQKAERARARNGTEKREAIDSDSNGVKPLIRSDSIQKTSELTRYRPLSVEHEVELRDRHQCTHVNRNGNRCASKRWLEKHHIKEFANGGEHSLENLETLCSAHHRIKHRLAVSSH